jgi:hypothetical protein
MRKLKIGIALAFFTLGLGQSAEAGSIKLKISSSTCSVACADLEITGGANEVVFAGLFGDIELVISAGTSNNTGTPGLAYLQQIDITTNTLGAAEMLTIELSQTDFLLPTGPAHLGSSTGGSGFSLNGGSSATFTSAYSSANTYFDYQLMTADLACNIMGVAPPGACSAITSTPVNAMAPYSLTNRFVLNLGVNSSLALTGTTTVTVPESGSTMAFLGFGLLVVGLVSRKVLV